MSLSTVNKPHLLLSNPGHYSNFYPDPPDPCCVNEQPGSKGLVLVEYKSLVDHVLSQKRAGYRVSSV